MSVGVRNQKVRHRLDLVKMKAIWNLGKGREKPPAHRSIGIGVPTACSREHGERVRDTSKTVLSDSKEDGVTVRFVST